MWKRRLGSMIQVCVVAHSLYSVVTRNLDFLRACLRLPRLRDPWFLSVCRVAKSFTRLNAPSSRSVCFFFQFEFFFFSGLSGFSVLARLLTGSRAGFTGGDTCGSGFARFLFLAGGGGGGGGGGAGAGAGAGSGLFFLVVGFCSCVRAFLFLPLTRGGATVMGRVCVAALGVFAMLNVSALALMVPAPGGGGGGLLEDDAATSRGAGACPWIVVPRRSIATSRSVMPAISCDFR